DRLTILALLAAVVLALGAAAGGFHALPITLLITSCLTFAAAHTWLLQWRTMLGAVVLCILFVPIKRYELPVSLPMQLEPYRLLVLGVGAGMLASLLIDRRLRLRATGLDAPLAMLALAMLLSVMTRSGHILSEGLSKYSFRSVSFFATYLIVFYLVTLAIRRRSDVEMLLRLLVFGATVVGLLAVVEEWAGYNFFDHLQQYVSILRFQGVPYTTDRGGVRAYASAQHPIAMGAALILVLPLGIYLAHSTRKKRWWLACGLLVLGALATKSRTAIIMIVVILVVLSILKPVEARRLVPKMVIPLLLVAHVAMPGTLGTLKSTIFPSGGIVNAETNADVSWHSNYGKGRIGEWGPALQEWQLTPLFGQGAGTRVSDLEDPKMNAPILDDQWLWSLLELGVFGVVALLWFFVAAIRRFGGLARRDPTENSWLLTGLAASTTAYAVGMLTFDAFNFVQVTMMMFLIVALGVAALRSEPSEDAEPAR
ncbi:MAG TPA: O-antigen ligase family protein, partial [Baekduia sp.]|nr:O-antigen ligase family protein [Baekduia sp.]